MDQTSGGDWHSKAEGAMTEVFAYTVVAVVAAVFLLQAREMRSSDLCRLGANRFTRPYA